MTDRREAIMVRLTEIADTIAGVQTVARNRTMFDDDVLPAIAILEGDESLSEEDNPRVPRPSARPYQMTAFPQIFIKAIGQDVGTTLNTIRAAYIKAALEDAELNALSVNGRNVRLAAMQSELHAARKMVGEFALVLSITYVVDPREI